MAAEWDLVPDGPARTGPRAALPVRTSGSGGSGGEAALLELVTDGAPTEHLALRAWAGHGAVCLLRADPRRAALLSERTDPLADLNALPVLEACAVAARLMGRLHRPALPQPPTLTDLAPRWIDQLARLARTGLVPRRFADQARQWVVELTAGPGAGETLLHGNLHSGVVRRAVREPWLVVAPRPIGGEPSFEVAPLLAGRWGEAEASGDLRAALRQRLTVVTDEAGLDEDRTRAWVCVRTMVDLAAAADRGRLVPQRITRAVTLVKAVQD